MSWWKTRRDALLRYYFLNIGVTLNVPTNVPKRGPRTIIRQPTPTRKPINNGPEIDDFRPVL
jgi:hypothetical protein